MFECSAILNKHFLPLLIMHLYIYIYIYMYIFFYEPWLISSLPDYVGIVEGHPTQF